MEFQFGDWLVSPEANIVSNGDAKTQLEPRVMAVLRYLCRHPGAVIPAEEILQACWGSNELGDNPVHKAITQLRRAFGDSSTEPRYIETIRKRGYRAIAPVVTLAAPPSTTWEGGSPFRGLEAFQENHAAIFFGRVQATAQLRELVMTQAAHGCPMALVLGPSGSGKTSLVRAGLLPHLMAGATRSDEPVGLVSTVYLDCADLGSGTLFQALAGALIDADINGEPLFPGASADSLGQRLAEAPESVAAELRNRACTRPMVGVFVDRLEAIFRPSAADANHFMATVEALARSKCLLMLMGCRNDFYPDVMAQPVLLALKTRGGHFDVLPPDGADIAQIVREPAQTASLTFDKDVATGANLDDVLCDAARGNPDMLPLLQYALNELYRQRSDNGILKFEVYRQLGGIEGAVGVRAEQVVSNLTPSQISALPHVLSLLVNVGEDQTAVTSRRSPLDLLRTEDEKELVRVMVEARLFVSELAGDVPSFGVAHEALLRRWPRVVDWIERYRAALQVRTRLEGQAARWDEAKRPRDQLLPHGSQVNQAADLLRLPDFALTPSAREYIRASIGRAKFGERIRMMVMITITLLAVLAGGLGLAARSAQNEAEQKRADAEDLLTFMLGEFVDKLRPLGRLELLDNISGKAMVYLAQPSAAASPNVTVQRAKALHLLYEVNVTRGKRDEATAALEAARQLLLPLKNRDVSDRLVLRQLGINAFMFGKTQMANEELAKAEESMREYLQFAERFAATSPSDDDGLLEQSYAHNSLGSIAMKRQEFKLASNEFRASLKLKEQLQKRKPADQSLMADISNSYSWLAESHLKLGEMGEAMALYLEEEKLLRAIHTGNANWTYRLVLSLMRQSILHQAQGNINLALSTTSQAEALLDEIVKLNPSNTNWLARLYQSRARQIELQPLGGDTAAKLLKIVALNDVLHAMNAKDPKNSNLSYILAKTRLVQASLLVQLGRHDEAANHFTETIGTLKAVHAGKDNEVTYATTLGEALLTRADLYERLGRHESALQDCREAANLLKDRAGSTTDFALLALNVKSQVCLGNQDDVQSQVAALEGMGFKDPRYKHYFSNPRKKGVQ